MKAIILKHENGGSYVLDRSGEFRFVRGFASQSIGAEIIIRSQVAFAQIRAAAIAACVVLVVALGSFGFWANAEGCAVYVDINPGVELTFNNLNILKASNPLNGDGEVLLDSAQVKGKTGDVIVDLIKTARGMGYVGAGDDSPPVLITVAAQKGKHADSIKSLIEAALAKNNMQGLATVEVCDGDLRARADQLGISPGRLALIERLYESGSEIGFDEFITLYITTPVSDLLRMVTEAEGRADPITGSGDPADPVAGSDDPGDPNDHADGPGRPGDSTGDPGDPNDNADDPGEPNDDADDPAEPNDDADDPGEPNEDAGGADTDDDADGLNDSDDDADDPAEPDDDADDPAGPNDDADDSAEPDDDADDPVEPNDDADDSADNNDDAEDPDDPDAEDDAQEPSDNNGNNNSNNNHYPPPTPTYTVTFVDWDGAMLKQELHIRYGSAAVAPDDPTRRGYSFSGWDIDFHSVVRDETVTATYSENNSYKVRWDANGGDPVGPPPHGKDDVRWTGRDLLPAGIPTRAGYRFDGWVLASGANSAVPGALEELSPRVAADAAAAFADLAELFEMDIDTLMFEAVWTVELYTVTFVDWDGEVLKTEHGVPHGSAAAAPADPEREGYTFSGWDTDFGSVTSDLTVKAEYTQNQTLSCNVYWSFNLNGFDGQFVLGRENVGRDDVNLIPVDAPDREGYSFDGWALVAGIRTSPFAYEVLFTLYIVSEEDAFSDLAGMFSTDVNNLYIVAQWTPE